MRCGCDRGGHDVGIDLEFPRRCCRRRASDALRRDSPRFFAFCRNSMRNAAARVARTRSEPMAKPRNATEVHSLSEFRANASKVVRGLRRKGHSVVLTQRGREAAVLIDEGAHTTRCSRSSPSCATSARPRRSSPTAAERRPPPRSERCSPGSRGESPAALVAALRHAAGRVRALSCPRRRGRAGASQRRSSTGCSYLLVSREAGGSCPSSALRTSAS